MPKVVYLVLGVTFGAKQHRITMQKFYVDDCPVTLPVGRWIKSQLPWKEAKNDVLLSIINRAYLNYVFKFTGNLQGLQDSVKQALDTYGFHGWVTAEGEEELYGGYSITYNPNLQYKDQPIHQHTLGTKLNSAVQGDFYAGSPKNHNGILKNSYLDGCSFTEFTPAAKLGYMGTFLEEMNKNVTITRSRLGIVKGNRITNSRFHIDAELFELTRLNIPITGDDNFVFEFKGREPYCLELGKAYSWNTEFPHRVYCRKQTNIDRANMVIGWSPWLSYNKEERYWYTNKFFGKKYPFDMLIDGDVTDNIKLIDTF